MLGAGYGLPPPIHTSPGSRADTRSAVAALALLSLAACGGDATDSRGPAGADESTAETAEALAAAPVCVTLTRLGASGSVRDAQIKSNTPDKANGSSESLNAGIQSGVERQSLLWFDLSPIPPGPGTTIQSATLTLTTYALLTTLPGTMSVHRILSPWSETAVTWNTFAGAYDPAISTTLDAAAPTGSLLPLVRAWVAGTVPNEGILVRQPGGNNTAFWASEFSLVGMRPKLQVCYSTTCAAGFADCNNSGADGCETDVRSSVANCGACGVVCSVPHATAACLAGVCGVGACAAGYFDCDGDPSNGCEATAACPTGPTWSGVAADALVCGGGSMASASYSAVTTLGQEPGGPPLSSAHYRFQGGLVGGTQGP